MVARAVKGVQNGELKWATTKKDVEFVEITKVMVDPQYTGWNNPSEFKGSIKVRGTNEGSNTVRDEYSDFPKILEYSNYGGDLNIDVYDKNGNWEFKGYADSSEQITYRPDVESSRESPELDADDWTELPQDVVNPDQNTFEGCESVIVASEEEGVTFFDSNTSDDIVDRNVNNINGQNAWVRETCQ